jgi:hypothetical protein
MGKGRYTVTGTITTSGSAWASRPFLGRDAPDDLFSEAIAERELMRLSQFPIRRERVIDGNTVPENPRPKLGPNKPSRSGSWVRW